MNVQMDDRYASALREALIDYVQTAPERRQRAARRLTLGVARGPAAGWWLGSGRGCGGHLAPAR